MHQMIHIMHFWVIQQLKLTTVHQSQGSTLGSGHPSGKVGRIWRIPHNLPSEGAVRVSISHASEVQHPQPSNDGTGGITARQSYHVVPHGLKQGLHQCATPPGSKTFQKASKIRRKIGFGMFWNLGGWHTGGGLGFRPCGTT